MVLPALLPGETRPTWAYPAHYTPALACSVLSMLLPLTRLAVRSARCGPGGRAAFPCSVTIPSGWFRFALYTGSAAFALGDSTATNLTACLLAQAYQSLWLVDFHDACERSISLTVSSDSSALLNW